MPYLHIPCPVSLVSTLLFTSHIRLPNTPLDFSSNAFSDAVPPQYFARTASRWTLDVRSNMLVGEVDALANGTAWYDNNYFSSTVFDASSCDPAVTPATLSFRRNCIPPTVCDAMPQRTDAECAAFCGLAPAATPEGEVCGGQGMCALLPQQPVQAGVCSCEDSFQNGEDPATCVDSSAPSFPLFTTLRSSSLPTVTGSNVATADASNGTIMLTTFSANEWGAALLAAPTRLFSFALRKAGCGRPFAFSVAFSFQLTPAPGKKSSGGIAFVIASADSASTGDVFGLGYSGFGAKSVAVEFDGFQDKNLTIKDMSANHVGLNLNGNPFSVAAATSAVVFGDGKVKYAWIDYVPLGDTAGTVSVFVAATAVKPVKAALSAPLSLCAVLGPVEGEESFYVGFTGASTTLTGQRNVILSYTINTSLPNALAPKPTVAYPLGFAFTKDAFSSLNANRFSRHVSVGSSATAREWTPKDAVNWNDMGLPWPVKDQLKCADSWAFALVGSIEAAYSIVGNLSKSTIFKVDPLRTSLKTNCKGGNPTAGLQFLVTSGKVGGGLTAQTTYTRPMGVAAAALRGTKPVVPTFPIAGFERAPSMGWFGLLLAVQQQPVVVAIQATAPSFISYNGLFKYQDPACFTFSPNHAVLVVGYRLSGSDPALPHIAAPYWIIRNSWGEGWGDGGHMRMDMQGGYGVCGINTLPGVYPVVKSSSDACNKDVILPDGTPLANPCGGFACTVNGTTNKCACDGTYYVQATNLDGSRTCTLVDVCGASGFNPCGVGTCVNDGVGSYSCVCPANHRQGITIDGTFSCAPSLTLAANYTVRGGEVTCAHVHQTLGLTLKQLQQLNSALDCNAAIPINTTIITTRTAPLLGCSAYYTTTASDTCLGIATRHGLTDNCDPVENETCTSPSTTACVKPCSAALQTLNPGLDCSVGTDGTLPAYLSVCVKVDYLYVPRVPACPHVHTVAPGETCDVLRSTVAGGMSLEELLRLNPGILCDRLAMPVPAAAAAVIPNYDLCWADAYDPQIPTCPRPYVVLKADTCDTILPKSFGGSHDCFRQINGYECLNPLQLGARICLPDPAALSRGRCLV
ncbi:hypothetical protein CLOM_g11511 [Closterium sp. NIES-68]|nr:hypothetical protein CLOM_g11511 [Closterium sp. NIES-68]